MLKKLLKVFSLTFDNKQLMSEQLSKIKDDFSSSHVIFAENSVLLYNTLRSSKKLDIEFLHELKYWYLNSHFESCKSALSFLESALGGGGLSIKIGTFEDTKKEIHLMDWVNNKKQIPYLFDLFLDYILLVIVSAKSLRDCEMSLEENKILTGLDVTQVSFFNSVRAKKIMFELLDLFIILHQIDEEKHGKEYTN